MRPPSRLFTAFRMTCFGMTCSARRVALVGDAELLAVVGVYGLQDAVLEVAVVRQLQGRSDELRRHRKVRLVANHAVQLELLDLLVRVAELLEHLFVVLAQGRSGAPRLRLEAR